MNKLHIIGKMIFPNRYPLTKQDYLDMGFKPLPHFTVMGSLIYDLGRDRHLSVGSACTPNEMIFLCQMDPENPRCTESLVVVHNYDYDGYMTRERLTQLIKGLTSPKTK